MKYYAVVTDYFDDGRVRANSFAVEADKMPESKYEQRKQFDRYTDYFDTPEDAEQWRQNSLNA